MSARAPEAAIGPQSDRAFSPRVALALVLTGVFAALAFLVLQAYAPDIKAHGQGGANALSPSAVGYAGVVRLLQATGQPAVIIRAPKTLNRFDGLLVVTPNQPLKKGDLQRRGDTLVVLPKWSTADDPAHPGWVFAVDTAPAPAFAHFADSQLGPFTITRRKGRAEGVTLSGSLDGFPPQGLPLGPVRSLQTVAGPQLTPLLTDPSGAVVLAAFKGSRTFVLSDPDLLNTQGVADPRTARIALLTLYNLHDTGTQIGFDVTLNGLGAAPSLLKLAFEPPFLGVTLCLALAAIMIGVGSWSRFGPTARTARAVALGKTALVDNGAGMIRLARREPRMAARYVRLVRDHAARALGAADMEEAAQTGFLDRWAEHVGAQQRISRLQEQAAQVKTGRELTLLAQHARTWRREMTREPE